jgi:hypothetical protein
MNIFRLTTLSLALFCTGLFSVSAETLIQSDISQDTRDKKIKDPDSDEKKMESILWIL